MVLTLAAGVGTAAREAGAIPVYARRHNLGCASCHLGGALTDVTISYPQDLTTQMLEYSGVRRP